MQSLVLLAIKIFQRILSLYINIYKEAWKENNIYLLIHKKRIYLLMGMFKI